jgi:hypothetical protein
VPTRNKIDRSVLKGESIRIFRSAVRSPYTLDPYERRLTTFLKIMNMTPDKLVQFAKKNPGIMEKRLISFIDSQRERASNKEITGSTISNYLKPIHLLLYMNDVSLNWKKTKRLLPSSKRYAEDRIPTSKEIQEILEALIKVILIKLYL